MGTIATLFVRNVVAYIIYIIHIVTQSPGHAGHSQARPIVSPEVISTWECLFQRGKLVSPYGTFTEGSPEAQLSRNSVKSTLSPPSLSLTLHVIPTLFK